MAQISMGRLVITFILMILGLSLTGTVADTVYEAGTGNVTGVAKTLLDLVPMFWVLIVLAIGVVAVYMQFKGVD